MRYLIAIAFSLAVLLTVHVHATARQVPDRLSDADFWQMIEGFSEEGGSWDRFYISNEFGYPSAVAQLLSNKNQGGVYLGVGPEQNFTYIAAVRPSIAFVVDIRRENMLEHLMYRALFEISPTRSAFVSRLFSRAISSPPRLVPTACSAEPLVEGLQKQHPAKVRSRMLVIADAARSWSPQVRIEE